MRIVIITMISEEYLQVIMTGRYALEDCESLVLRNIRERSSRNPGRGFQIVCPEIPTGRLDWIWMFGFMTKILEILTYRFTYRYSSSGSGKAPAMEMDLQKKKQNDS